MLNVSLDWQRAVRQSIRPAAHIQLKITLQDPVIPQDFYTSDNLQFITADEEVFTIWSYTLVFDDSSVVSYTQTNQCSPIMSQLPDYTCEFSIDNTNKTFNPENLNGVSGAIKDRTKVEVLWGFDCLAGEQTEWITASTFYLTDWEADPNLGVATFKGSSLLEFATNEFTDGEYDGTPRTVHDLMLKVLRGSGISEYAGSEEAAWSLSPGLSVYSTSIPLPRESCNTLLQKLAALSEHIITTDPSTGKLIFEKPSFVQIDNKVSSSVLLSQPKIVLDPELYTCVVSSYRPQVPSSTDTVYEEQFSVTNSLVVETLWDTPYTDYTVSLNVSEGSVVVGDAQLSAYKGTVTLVGSGTCTLLIEGKPISFTQKIAQSYLANNPRGQSLVLDNAIVSDPNNAYDIGVFAANLTKVRQRISCDYAADPSMQPMDVYLIDTYFGTVPILVTKCTLSYNGGWTGTIEGMQTFPRENLPGNIPITGTFSVGTNRRLQLFQRERSI